MPYKNPEKRREYERARVLTPEQKKSKSERLKERRKAPVFVQRERECGKIYRANLTEAQKARRRAQAREYQRRKRATMTLEELEALRAYHREHDRKRVNKPERREYVQ